MNAAGVTTAHASGNTDDREGLHGKTFALTFTSNPIKMPSDDTGADMRQFFLDVEHALEALPNGVIDNVKVNGEYRISPWVLGSGTQAWEADQENMEISDRSANEGATAAMDGGEADADSLYINVTFLGASVQGPQNLITVKHIACADGCTPKLDGLDLRYNTMNVTEIVGADYNSYECGRRGKCDYKTGICSCFNGYSGLSCGTITSLV